MGGPMGGVTATPALQAGQYAVLPGVVGSSGLAAAAGLAQVPYVPVPATYGALMFSTKAPQGSWPPTIGQGMGASSMATLPQLAVAGGGPPSSMPLSLAATSPNGVVTYQAYAPTITSTLASAASSGGPALAAMPLMNIGSTSLSSWTRRGVTQYAGAYLGPTTVSAGAAGLAASAYSGHAMMGSAGYPFSPTLPGSSCGDGWGSQYGTF